MSAAMIPSPSFPDVGLQTFEEVLAEWREDDNGEFELLVAERDGGSSGRSCFLPPAARSARAGRDGIDLARGLDRAGGARNEGSGAR
jgi:hypothetical protein